jgi:GAF domain-containing protein
MHKETLYPQDRHEAYQLLLAQAEQLIKSESDTIAQLANISALLKEFYQDDVNWVGFYRLENEELILGPFQGKVACTRLPKGKGVCQKAVSSKQTIIVDDVHLFSDHIACDSASKSEIVVPLMVENRITWVLDADSPKLANFDQLDIYYLERLIELLK